MPDYLLSPILPVLRLNTTTTRNASIRLVWLTCFLGLQRILPLPQPVQPLENQQHPGCSRIVWTYCVDVHASRINERRRLLAPSSHFCFSRA